MAQDLENSPIEAQLAGRPAEPDAAAPKPHGPDGLDQPLRARARIAPTPIVVLLSLARGLIAVTAVVLLLTSAGALLDTLFAGYHLAQAAAFFMAFVVCVIALLLFEIWDLLRNRLPPQPPPGNPAPIASTAAVPIAPAGQLAGRLVLAVWLPLQSETFKRVVANLTFAERDELHWRLAMAAACGICTTIVPVAVGFVMLSPVALCVAVTMLGANLFLLDRFRTLQKRWLCRSEYARRENIQPAAL